MGIKSLIITTSIALGLAMPGVAAATTIDVTEDVMTSSFFQGTNTVRGYAAESNRPVMRVSTDDAFGLTGAETIYLNFEDDFSSYTTPFTATLTMQSVDGGFNANADNTNPFLVSTHAVNANPFTSITDDTNPTGTISWLDFYNNNILAADAAGSSMINGFGAVTFDVTSIVRSWADGSNTNQFIALTGKNDTSGLDFLHGFQNNNNGGTALGTTFLTISAVPEPETYGMLLAGITIIGAIGRRRK